MIYLFLADGFEEVEALTPADYLRRCGAELKTVAIGTSGRMVTGSHGISVEADLSEQDVNLEQMEMLILPGGMPGTLHLEQSPVVQQAIEYAVRYDLYIGAICAAPSILGHCGLLQGKRATAYPGFEKDLLGAEVTGLPVCRDGKIITSRGAGTAGEFAFALAEALYGAARADELKAAVQWQR
ncbi:MAG TPA: DJ-1/PfpI family protein [Firmicutes bacterium]|nr:DJ-1/PfpI family protein [Bacillota bacterium]